MWFLFVNKWIAVQLFCKLPRKYIDLLNLKVYLIVFWGVNEIALWKYITGWLATLSGKAAYRALGIIIIVRENHLALKYFQKCKVTTSYKSRKLHFVYLQKKIKGTILKAFWLLDIKQFSNIERQRMGWFSLQVKFIFTNCFLHSPAVFIQAVWVVIFLELTINRQNCLFCT